MPGGAGDEALLVQKQAPTVGRILVMAIFTLSCFGLLLYLWSAFGGPVPLKPHGYRFETSFAEATQLAQEADVRISGVNVGTGQEDRPGRDGRTDATIELKDQYAPIPQDSRAILRQKTLLGETYVELTPGHQDRAGHPGGRPARGRAGRADGGARRDLPRVRQEDARELPGLAAGPRQGHRGPGRRASRSSSACCPTFARGHERGAEDPELAGARDREAIKNTGVVFDALTERGDQLSQWISNSNDAAAHDRPAATTASAPCSRRSRPSSTSPTRR